MNQNKGFYRTIVISNLALSILILLYLFTSCFISIDNDSATIGIVVGVTATFIGVCTTLMLGAQIYTVYRSSQSEKELQHKFKELEDKYESYHDQMEVNLNEVVSVKNEIEQIRYDNNDSLATAHYSMNYKFRATLNVLDNIYLLLTKKEVFSDNIEKYRFEIYSIAKNFKEYKSDVFVMNNEKLQFIDFVSKWNKKFDEIKQLPKQEDMDNKDLLFLNEVINTYSKNTSNNERMPEMNKEHHDKLCIMA